MQEFDIISTWLTEADEIYMHSINEMNWLQEQCNGNNSKINNTLRLVHEELHSTYCMYQTTPIQLK